MNFKDQQKQRRLELYSLIAQDNDWFKKPDTERYKRITELGQQLVQYSEDSAKRTVNKEKYLCLRAEGYTIRQIASALHISLKKLKEWREENQLD